MYSVNKEPPKQVSKYRISPAIEGVILGLFALLLTFITAYFIYYNSMTVLRNEIKDSLLRMVCSLAQCIDGDLVETFTDPAQANNPEYLDVVKKLQKIRIATKHCSYLYITRKVGNEIYFVVDPVSIKEDGTPLYDDEASLEPSIPMSPYKDADDDLKYALTNATAVVAKDQYTDRWGTFYSSHAPIFNSKHECVGALGADLRVDEMLSRCKPMEDATKRAFFVSVSLALLLGTFVWFSRRFASQLNESRLNIFDNFLVAKEFADQTSTNIAKQFYRTSDILRYNARRLKVLSNFDSKDVMRTGLVKEQKQLAAYAEKLLTLGELKFTKRPDKLINFSLREIQDSIKKLFIEKGFSGDLLHFSINEEVPETLYGPVQSYEELVGHITEFCLNMFEAPVNSTTTMINEGSRDVEIRQTFQVSSNNLKIQNRRLIEAFCRNIVTVNWGEQLELSASINIPIIQELMYVLSSKLFADLKDDMFTVSFDFMLHKAAEEDEEE